MIVWPEMFMTQTGKINSYIVQKHHPEQQSVLTRFLQRNLWWSFGWPMENTFPFVFSESGRLCLLSAFGKRPIWIGGKTWRYIETFIWTQVFALWANLVWMECLRWMLLGPSGNPAMQLHLHWNLIQEEPSVSQWVPWCVNPETRIHVPHCDRIALLTTTAHSVGTPKSMWTIKTILTWIRMDLLPSDKWKNLTSMT